MNEKPIQAMESIGELGGVSKRKRGDKREDGMVFWCRSAKKVERWVTQEKFDELVIKEAEKVKRRVEENPERYLENQKAWYQTNREYVDAKTKEYSKKNPEKRSAYVKKWKDENRDAWRKLHRERQSKRRAEDPIFAMMVRCRGRIANFIRKKGMKKGCSTQKMIGCTWQELASHIEAKFTDGMNWLNRGLWEVDHITPLASAKTEEDILRLCHFSNLQPLWREDNRIKSDKIPEITVDTV